MRSSYIWAGVFALALGGWLASGQLSSEPADPIKTAVNPGDTKQDTLFRVVVKEFTAKERQAQIIARGQTAAAKMVDVRNRTPGIVEKVNVSGGNLVQAGDVLCVLDNARKLADIARAKAEMASAQRDYDAAAKLEKQQFSSAANVATLKARLDAAKASMVQAETEMQWTEVVAPVSGTIAEPPVEQGFFMQTGQICARIAIMDPIKITAQVGERDIGFIREGQIANARLVTGQKLEGKITFVSPVSDLSTRTFKVEIKAPNPDRVVRAGVTASLEFDLPPTKAHLLPSYLISLNDNGEVGVRAIAEDLKTVKFLRVKLIQHTRKGIWVAGLPEKVNLITVGQDYVLDGQVVNVVHNGPAETGTVTIEDASEG